MARSEKSYEVQLLPRFVGQLEPMMPPVPPTQRAPWPKNNCSTQSRANAMHRLAIHVYVRRTQSEPRQRAAQDKPYAGLHPRSWHWRWPPEEGMSRLRFAARQVATRIIIASNLSTTFPWFEPDLDFRSKLLEHSRRVHTKQHDNVNSARFSILCWTRLLACLEYQKNRSAESACKLPEIMVNALCCRLTSYGSKLGKQPRGRGHGWA